ncbi:MAG: dephospho-CoA kinase [Clostridiales Family XIII bacterium]|jgi:dephospho-CoA kinase|nr:dephospho-CoA kinase [Clostridiales Family XIII bacterium]
MLKIIGITGGIGSGKSTVTDYLAEKGYPIVDADKISRQVAEKGQPAVAELAARFGEDILDGEGNLLREKLAERVFPDEEKTRELNDIMHREIIRQMDDQLAFYELQQEPMVYLSAPLLFEAGLTLRCDEVWVVDADEDLRVVRAAERDGISVGAVRARAARQLSDEQRRRRADVLLDNSGSVEALLAQVDELLIKEYEQLTNYFY